MAISTTGASTIRLEGKPERQCIKKALVLQLTLYSQITFKTGIGDEFIYTESYNGNSAIIPDDYVEDNREISLSMPITESSNSYLQNIFKISNQIRNLIQGELANQFVDELIVKIYLFTVDNGDILSRLFSCDEAQNAEYLIRQNFYDVIAVSNPRIKDISICAIGNYDRIVTTSNESLKNDNGKTIFPSIDDVKEAIVLCQKTYNSQSSLETSIPNVINTSLDKYLRNRKKNSEGKGVESEEIANSKKIDGLFSKTGCRIADTQDHVFNFIKPRLKSLDNGFYSVLYVKEFDSGKKRYYYCTCGTNFSSIIDWKNNISQGATGLSSQYTMSVQNAQMLNDAIGSDELIFIGHSLGGGLASNNAIVTGRKAITFNAAGLNPLRLAVTGNSTLANQIKALWNWKENSAINRSIGKQLVHAFIIEDEILNKSLSNIFDESAVGTPHIIEMDSSIPSSKRHSLMKFINSDTGNEDFYELEKYFKTINAS